MSIKSRIVHPGKFVHWCSQGLGICVTCSMSIRHIPCKAPNICSLFWSSPWFSFFKLNTDGLSKENHGHVACEGVFRDWHGQFLGWFCQGIGHQNYAKLSAVIMGVEFAAGWTMLWFESNFASALSYLRSNDHLFGSHLRDEFLLLTFIEKGM